MRKNDFFKSISAMTLQSKLKTQAIFIENELNALFKAKNRLDLAMCYGTLNGGKRLRPFLVLETAHLFGVGKQALEAALAVELIHCYSLIHDDLPAMDNDDLRRGKPTVHKYYDEATAILAGDGLLTLAFETLANQTNLEPITQIKLIKALATASGRKGMVGGQMLDLAAEGRFSVENNDIDAIYHLQSLKTGALLHFSCLAGAILGEANAIETKAISDYGNYIGLAFQIADDILDYEGDAQIIGKAVGKDATAGKATLVQLLGIEAAKEKLKETVKKAQESLDIFGERAETLKNLAIYIATRDK